MKNYILAHDLGTSGNKSVIYDNEGNQINKTFTPYNTYYNQPGWSEQSPNDWWEAIKKSTMLLAETNINKKLIRCISFSGQSMGIVPVDRRGTLLRKNTPIWNDSRAIIESRKILEKIGERYWYKNTGSAFRPENHSAFKIYWFKKHESELFKRTYKFLPTKNFIIMKLTGKFTSDYTDASFTGLFNIRTLDYWDKILDVMDLPREKLPDLLPSISIVGEITSSAAEEIGLEKNTLVVSGGVDNSCAALGAGCIVEGRTYNSLGSSAWISTTSKSPIISKTAKIPCYVHVIPDLYLSQASTFAAGAAFKWFRDVLCQEIVATGKISKIDPFIIMDEIAKKSDAGAGKIIFNPSLMGGSTIYPSHFIKGAFIGLSLPHKKSDIIRSVLEGITFDQCLALNEYRKMGIDVSEIRVVGGGSKSNLWRQIMADIFKTRIVYTNIGQEAAALGATAIGAIATGLWDNFSIIDRITKIEDIKEPINKNVKIYENILPVFRDLNTSLLKFGELLSKI